MTDIFSGDVYITLGPNGSNIHYKGGQPVMDAGVENQAIIALFTDEGWVGNLIESDPDKHIGSANFLKATRKPITLNSLAEAEQGIVADLASPVFGDVTATVINPESNRIDADILIKPPGQAPFQISLQGSGVNWQAQAVSPAHGRIG